MEKVYLATYKGIHKGLPGIVNRGIRFMDRTIYSHCELCIGDPFEKEVECFSSSGVDHGVRVKRMKLDKSKWDIMLLPRVSEGHLRDCFEKTKGQPYDYFGTGRFMLPFLLREHPVRWFCSEWTAWVMGHAEPWRFSPAACRVLALADDGIVISY